MSLKEIRNRNRTIVAIAVHPKIEVGGHYWYCERDGQPMPIVITSTPYYRKHMNISGGSWWIKFEFQGANPYVYEESLGDAGFPGFAYDDRPCRIVKDLPTAMQRVKEIDAWHVNEEFYDPPMFDY